jgi:hypothetical protein
LLVTLDVNGHVLSGEPDLYALGWNDAGAFGVCPAVEDVSTVN